MSEPEYLDQQWYGAYDRLSSGLENNTELRDVPNMADKKQRFISEGFSENPDLQPQIKIARVQVQYWAWNILHDRIVETETDGVVQDAYLPLITSKLRGLDFLTASANGDTETFVAKSKELYGNPDQQIFDALLGYVRAFAERHRDDASADFFVREAAREVCDILPEGSPAKNIWPSERSFAKVRRLFSGFFDEMYAGIELPDEITSEQAMDILPKVIKNLGFDVKVKARQDGLSTQTTSSDNLLLPVGQTYSRQRFMGLEAHELRIHHEEEVNGSRRALRILGTGLHGYIRASEGKGVLVEQIAYKSWADFMATERFFDIARRHLSISLAAGLDGNGERDFKEVFQIMYPIDRLWELVQKPEKPTVAMSKAIDRTWQLLTKRTLKGLVGKGAADYKDKVYVEGNLDQWRLLSRKPEVFPYLNLGKYDLTNPAHVRILKQIGTIPVNLSV